MDKRFMVLLQTSFLKEENHTDETLNLSFRVSFQLVHPSLDDQGNAFMGCDCHIELVFKAWKSHLHLATLPTKTVNSTLCCLYGRMLLILLTFALCPPLRATVWLTKRRELSLLKLIRHLQALADRWLHLLFAPSAALYSFLRRAYTTAKRLVLKALRTRRTTAQLLRDSLAAQHDFFEPALALTA
jgi:hypothetical protein